VHNVEEKISITKGFSNNTFDTYVPELSDNADIQNALEYFYYGNAEDGNTIDPTNSIYSNLIDFDNRIDSATAGLSGHIGGISDVHGVGAGNLVVGTGTSQTLTNKTLTSPIITTPTINAGVSGTVSISSTELGYLDGVTSSIQTQINTNTPTGMISIHAGSSAPTGWLLCDGTSYSTTTYANLFSTVGYTFGGSGENFSVPNLKGKVVVGTDGAQTQFDTRGETGGSMTHQHSASNSGDTTPTTSNASAGNTTGGASAGNTTGGASAGNTTGSNSANHSHSVNPPETATTGDNHAHATNTVTGILKVSSGSTSLNVASGQHTHGMDSDNHSHNVNIASLDSDNQSANHTHSTTDHSHDTADHTHSTTDHSHNTADHTHTVLHSHTTPASDSLSNLQPYMALNYIIKI
jgi:microcystin-dependent protein